MKRTLLCGASVAASTILLGLGVAPARAAEPAAGTQTTVGEVVVTAEKRGASLEKVPVAVTAFSSQQRELFGIKSIQDLTDFTPGFSYTSFDNRPYMRGVGRQTDNLAIAPGVATYIDGVYNGANASTILQNDSLFIGNVEILRGPQTTLYGQNADGGAINMTSKRPTKDPEAELRVGGDSYQKYFIEGVVSGPINDHLRIRLGGNDTQQLGGYYTNLSGQKEGGSVAQGGNGTSYHLEAQLEGDLGPHFDWWGKVATNDYSVSYHTETLLDPYDTAEFSNVLMPNQNYGLCTAAGDCGTGPGKLVPGSVVALPGTSPTNPALNNVRSFNGDFKSNANEGKDFLVSGTLTYHAPSFDIKYTGGYQTFYYDLSAPWVNSQGLSSSVEQFQVQGPAVATGSCSFLYGNAGCTQNLTVNPAKTQFTFIENEKFWSHELDFTSTNAGPVQWLAGLYYYGETYDQPINVLDPSQAQVKTPDYLVAVGTPGAGFAPAPANPTGSVYNEYTKLDSRSVSGFAQVDWQINSQFKLTGGIRDTDDHRSGYETFRLVLFDLEAFGLGASTLGSNAPAFDATSTRCPQPAYPGASACAVDPKTGLAKRSLDAHWNAITGSVNLAWTPDPSILAYARYSRGYKEGGFNSGIMEPYPETAPETVDAFELGLKKTVGGAFHINGDAFYYNYANEQQPLNIQPATGPIATLIYNIPKSESYGVELEAMWRPIDNLTLNVNYAYLVSKIVSTGGTCFEDTADPTATAPGANTSGCPAPVAGVQLQNIKGESLAEAPRNKVTADAAYVWRFEPGSLTLSGSVVWKEKTYDSPFNRSYNLAPDYTQANARLSWKDAKDRYTLILYCDNLFDKTNYDGVFGLATSAGIGRVASLTAPRTYGMEFQYRFK